MKKVAVLLLVLWGAGYAVGRKRIENWLPLPQWDPPKRTTYPPEVSQQPPQAPSAPATNSQLLERDQKRLEQQKPIANSKWMDQEQKRVDQMNLAPQCKAASEAMWTARTVGNSRGAYAVRQGNKVLSESERVALLAESEKFFNENCRR